MVGALWLGVVTDLSHASRPSSWALAPPFSLPAAETGACRCSQSQQAQQAQQAQQVLVTPSEAGSDCSELSSSEARWEARWRSPLVPFLLFASPAVWLELEQLTAAGSLGSGLGLCVLLPATAKLLRPLSAALLRCPANLKLPVPPHDRDAELGVAGVAGAAPGRG